MKKTNLPQDGDKTVTHLLRIRGQVDGLIRMYDEQRGCLEIAQQIVAVRNALGRVARDLLTKDATRCSREQKPDELNAILKELFR